MDNSSIWQPVIYVFVARDELCVVSLGDGAAAEPGRSALQSTTPPSMLRGREDVLCES